MEGRQQHKTSSSLITSRRPDIFLAHGDVMNVSRLATLPEGNERTVRTRDWTEHLLVDEKEKYPFNVCQSLEFQHGTNLIIAAIDQSD